MSSRSIPLAYWPRWLAGAVVVLVSALPAMAQQMGSSGGFGGSSGSTGGFGGSSGGGTSAFGSGSQTSTSFGSLTGTGSGSLTGTSFGTLTGTTSSSSTGSRTSTTGGRTGTTGIPQVPSPSNPFLVNYFNPLAQGQQLTSTASLLGTSTTPAAFGQPSLGTKVTATVTTARPGTTTSTSATGFSTGATPRAPGFVTALGFPAPPPLPAKLQADVSQIVASAPLPSRENVHVGTDGQVIVLTGVVADSRERRLLESLVRLTPGVHDVRNQLIIRPAAGGP